MAASPVKAAANVTPGTPDVPSIPFDISARCTLLDPNDLARSLKEKKEEFVILDCRPTLAYNSRRIIGALGINLNPMMTKRLKAGKVSLADIVFPKDQCQEKFQRRARVVVYDESTADPGSVSPTNALSVVLESLAMGGKTPYILVGGLLAFIDLHPLLCEDVTSGQPHPVATCASASMVTPGACEDLLAWQTAPPVHIQPYLILGNERDAMSVECIKKFGIEYILNVTEKCPNFFEGESDLNIKYLRIPASDTGRMKLLDFFEEANEFISQARVRQSCILIHCMAGISRSVTITIAYLMKQYHKSMQDAYDWVKIRRPSISPNLNFMGQLLEYERKLDLGSDKHSPDLLAMDPLAQALKESMKPQYMGSGAAKGTDRAGNISAPIINDDSGKGFEDSAASRTSSQSSTSSAGSAGLNRSISGQYGGVAHIVPPESSNKGDFSGSGLSASFSGSQSPFVLKRPSRQKRTQSEADVFQKEREHARLAKKPGSSPQLPEN